MTRRTTLLASALALIALHGPAEAADARLPEDRMYILHSKAIGTCPSLDWHIAASADGSLSGLIAWDGMKWIAKATGRVDRENRTFSMTAVVIGAEERKAAIDGQVRKDGWLIANVRGDRINCSAIAVPIYAGPPGSK
jgi:hypothetical protein